MSDTTSIEDTGGLLDGLIADTPISSADVTNFPDPIERLTGRSMRDRLLGDEETQDRTREAALWNETFAAFGDGFTPAKDFKDTYERIQDALGTTNIFRENEPPEPIQSWECRIGGSKFFVPPININVSKTFKAGSITGSTIRQHTSPKFNTGHTETVVQMTLYFPNYEEIWGIDEAEFRIDFDRGKASEIDGYLSSLRGLITQFRYAPILPIDNAYLNGTFGITGVALRSMSISTIENFPFVMAVNLTLLKFNHKVYLPMIQHFNQAIHWGRFRQYIGRASTKMAQIYKPIVEHRPGDRLSESPGTIERPIVTPQRGRGTDGSYTIRRHNHVNISAFDFYYPFHTPTNIDLPNLDDLLQSDWIDTSKKSKSIWQRLLGGIGFSVGGYPESDLDRVKSGTKGHEYNTLYSFLKTTSITADLMSAERLNEYIQRRLEETGTRPGTKAADELAHQIRLTWFEVMYYMLREDTTLNRSLAYQDSRDKSVVIQEWDIPMVRLGLDPSAVLVRGVSVTMGNTFSRLQLQLQDEPTHQHIGGEDTRVDISLIISGENAEQELRKLRNMFESINGLARLEHNHGVLGFLGVRNAITELVGMKHAIPLAFEVDTVPNFPHVYDVRITLTDFDVFQQKRELLSNEQQEELVEMFSKRNPFLRLKQAWGAFSSYPDFPLSVRDEEGKIVGHLDPDFYFRSFKDIDDDIVDPRPIDKERLLRNLNNPNFDFTEGQDTHEVNVCLGRSENGEPDYITANDRGLSLFNGRTPVLLEGEFNEPTGHNMVTTPNTEGLTPLSGYCTPYFDGDNPAGNYKAIAKDMQYRSKSGRMIRAFPTYMLWLIDEGGNFAGVKMFDDFYGLQSVLDFSVVQSEDILGDTLVLRLSNLYSRLSTDMSDLLDEEMYKTARIINEQLTRSRRLQTGLMEKLVQLDTVQLKPGVRVHLRMGYSANPNALDTVFNGVITEVQNGEVMTITAQSDAIELSALVNPTNEKGHTGKIDGNLFGYYLSEPRDLMITLLTMGSTVTKEVFAHATQGMVFSENKFGIRHFGSMLYKNLTEEEKEKHETQKARVAQDLAEDEEPSAVGHVPSGTNEWVMEVIRNFNKNLRAKRDYEVFKRNIYPGNGVGLAQYLGGDIGEFGLNMAIESTPSLLTDEGIDVGDPLAGITDPQAAIQAAIAAQNPEPTTQRTGPTTSDVGISGRILYGGVTTAHPLLQKMGLAKSDVDDGGYFFDEVAFRAQTYMKTVWDLFQVCASLLPDYIVAVRPFEERSTIFYGKPHWNYTSGVIPLTTGLDPIKAPPYIEPDEEFNELYRKFEEEMERRDHVQTFEAFFAANLEEAAGEGRTGGGSGGSAGGGTDPASPVQGNIATPRQIAQYAVNAKFTGELLVQMVAIAMAESGGKIDALGDTSITSATWGPSVGLWQIRSLNAQRGTAQPRDRDRLFDPQFNANSAMSIYQGQGLRAWSVTHEGSTNSYRVHMATARQAVGEVTGGSNQIQDSTEMEARRRAQEANINPNIELDSSFAPSASSGRDAMGRRRPGSGETPESSEDKVASVYKDYRTEAEAAEILSEFKSNFKNDEPTEGFFMDAPGIKSKPQTEKERLKEELFDQLVDDFMKIMWENPYARGWIVRVAHRKPEWIRSIVMTPFLGGDANPLLKGPLAWILDKVGDVAEGIADIGKSALRGLLDVAGGVFGWGSDAFGDLTWMQNRNWDLEEVYAAWGAYLAGSQAGLMEYLKQNLNVGRSQSNIYMAGIESVAQRMWGIKDTAERALAAVGNTLGGLINVMRLQMQQLSMGLSMASNMQKQTNRLNRSFNDSIYYSMGRDAGGRVVNPALYLADNPFTREYGEPVAEIREPFQRMHTLSSFQHIIHNGIVESIDGVATVVTAVSNGEHPVTVHFDKGAPAEKQMEKVVETGLFYDHPKGWFGLKKVIQPLATARYHTQSTGVASVETSAKRIALNHLKESLKDIYQGEVTILGDASIRPHDLVFLGDIYSRMYGFVEVEQVVHHFTPETGFVTSITPNACVTINDPARFSFLTSLRASQGIHDVRQHMRESYKGYVASESGIATESAVGKLQGEITVDELANKMEQQIRNSLQYTQGSSALVKSIASTASAEGLFKAEFVLGNILTGGLMAKTWGAWQRVRSSLLDQQGCWINYLTHNGQPMDAGLSYNQSVAVGQQHGIGLLLGGMRIATIPTTMNGNDTIRLQDVIKGLEVNELNPSDHAQHLSMFVNDLNAEIRRLSGRGAEAHEFIENEVYYVRIRNVVDVDTFDVTPIGYLSKGGEYKTGRGGLSATRVRLAAVSGHEDPFKNDPPYVWDLNSNHPGVRASNFARERLLGKEVALRHSPTDGRDTTEAERLLVYVFSNAPEGLSSAQRRQYLLEAAGGYPEIRWDQFSPEGIPYTFDWEVVLNGHGFVFTNDLVKTIPDRGVIGAGGG